VTPNFIVAVMGIECAAVAVMYLFQKQYPLSLMFAGYTLANGAIYWIASKSAA
jgi:hypothetical protein